MFSWPRLLIPVLLAGALACASPPEIDRVRVERLVTTLAADDMEGRAAFTAGAERAAELIRGEFESAGLDTWAGADDYLQRFPVYTRSVETASVTLDGQEVPAERFLVRLGADAIDWSSDDPVDVVVVGPQDNVMGTFRSLRRSNADGLVLVDSSHAASVERVRRFIGGATRSLEPGTGTSTVVVLTDEPAVESYSIRATARTEEPGLANVVGVIPGRRDDEYVVFSAHYDHIGVTEPVDGDSIANGANDDASGTVAVIELARYFKALGQPERTLVFVAFTAEEMGGYGARYFASQLDPEQIVAMFNIEMIGKPAAEGPGHAWITGFEHSDFGTILQTAVAETEYSFGPDPYLQQNLFYRSDNVTLARLGVPAHTISTTPIDVDPDYHQVTDEVETLDLDHMTEAIRAIATAAVPIISAEATPTRIDPATVNR